MIEIRFHGRFGQPVGKLARSIGKLALQRGKHVQVFDAFAAVRPGAPMYSVVRVANDRIRERSANNTNPDVVVILDNSLFNVADVTKGLKKNGVVMALSSDKAVLEQKKTEFKFVPLDSFFRANRSEVEKNLLAALENQGVL